MDFQRFVDLYCDCSKESLKFVLRCFNDFYKRDEKAATMWINALCDLKIYHPEFKIELSSESLKSFFSPSQNKVVLYSLYLFDPTLFHELGHALYINKYGFYYRTEKFDKAIGNLRAHLEKMSELLKFSLFCKEEKAKIDAEIAKIGNNDGHREVVANLYNKRACLSGALDIIDAILKGQGFDEGIVILENNDNVALKVGHIAGHGKAYFQTETAVFNEIFANYAAISVFDEELLKLIDMVLGDELADLLKKVYDDVLVTLKKIEVSNLRK